MSKYSMIVCLFLLTLTANLCSTKVLKNYVPDDAQANVGSAGTLRHILDLPVPEEDGYTPLHIAVKRNNTNVLKWLLENGFSPNAQSKDGSTPLHLAAEEGNAEMTNLLIEYGADIEARTKNGFTPLHVCAKEGKVNVCGELLRNGAKYYSREEEGATALHIASRFRRFCMVKLLYEYAKDHTTLSNNLDNCNDGDGNVMRYLLENGEDPNAPDIDGYTPLHKAVALNYIDDAKALLEYGANPNAQSKLGIAPLHIAVAAGHVEMVTLLIDHKADVNLPIKAPNIKSERN